MIPWKHASHAALLSLRDGLLNVGSSRSPSPLDSANVTFLSDGNVLLHLQRMRASRATPCTLSSSFAAGCSSA